MKKIVNRNRESLAGYPVLISIDCDDFTKLNLFSHCFLFWFRRYLKHSGQCFIGYPKTSNSVKILISRCLLCFQLSSRCLDIPMKHCLSCFFYYVKLTNWRQFLCVCLVIDDKFRHHIVKVAVDPLGDSRVDPQTIFDNVMTKFIVNNRTGTLKTDINLFFTITNCRISRSRSLTRRMNFKFMCLSAYWP